MNRLSSITSSSKSKIDLSLLAFPSKDDKLCNCPEYLKENFSKISDTKLRQCTRASRLNFFLPRVLNQAVNTFYFTGIKDWNALPANIKEITNADDFRVKVKEHILTELKNKELCPFVYNS